MTIVVTTNGTFSTGLDTNLTILEIANLFAIEVGLEEFTKLIGSSSKDAKAVLHFLKETCEEIARRVDWGGTLDSVQFTGTGSNAEFDLPLDFARLQEGGAVKVNGSLIRGGLSDSDWNELTPVLGTPRFYYLRDDVISFYPFMSTSDTAVVHYVKKSFTVTGYDVFVADDDTLSIPHEVVLKGLVYRWRRRNGQQYSDYQSEFEAALSDYAGQDIEDRTP